MTLQKTQDFVCNMHEDMTCLGITENAIAPEKENYRPRTLIDQTLELIDPTPNIHTLFVQFNARYFWNVLLPVEIKWSNRMTSCAGVCTFHKRNKQCVISLSAPLLKLRPRKDLVETLLHEMIHGYLFLTNNDRDRDGHGPNFCKHMLRINKEAGTNITIYHNFHNEVKLYQQHWWKCNGPCQYKAPFFGTVRRAMNRAPGPSDFWWQEHQRNCNGQFIKIKEPENFKLRSKQYDKLKFTSTNKKSDKNITDWLANNTNATTPVSISSHSKVFHTNFETFTHVNKNMLTNTNSSNHINSSSFVNERNNQNPSLRMKKLGNTASNIHGWDTDSPNKKRGKHNTKNIISKSPKFSYSSILGGSNSGKSNLLNKFLHMKDNKDHYELMKKNLSSATDKMPANNPLLNLNQSKNDFVSCPICTKSILLQDIDKHVDLCLINGNKTKQEIETNTNVKFKTKSTSFEYNNNTDKLLSPIRTFFTPITKKNIDASITPNKRIKLDNPSESKCVSCPVCSKMLPPADINQHLDECLLETDTVHKVSISSSAHVSNNDSVILINSSSSDLDDSVFIESTNMQSCTNINANASDAANLEQRCLVCNAHIACGISLNEHLEECIGTIFNDDMITIDNNDDDMPVMKNNSIDNKYPCPVCMLMISENFMNQHLDTCLKDK